MTTPNDTTHASPASEDDSLAGLVQRLSDDLRQLTRRVDDHEDQILDTLEFLAAELDTLRDEVDGKTSQSGRSTNPRPHSQVGQSTSGDSSSQLTVPRRWAARASGRDWDTLIEWVNELRNDYSLPNGYIVPPCWPAHPGVVEELAALYRAWTNAVLTDAQAGAEGSSAVAAWHDRWLWPTLQRFKSAAYRISNCGQRHQIEQSLAIVGTNRAMGATAPR